MNTHKCEYEPCGEQIGNNQFMCHTHWSWISQDTRRTLIEAWADVTVGRSAALATYRSAKADAQRECADYDAKRLRARPVNEDGTAPALDADELPYRGPNA